MLTQTRAWHAEKSIRQLALERPLEVGDGWSAQAIDDAQERLGIVLPSALREWYEIAGQRGEVWSCQDVFLTPEKLRVEDGKLVICVENQGVVTWGIAVEGMEEADDPAVFLRETGCDEWVEEAAEVSRFALAKLMLDLKFCGTVLHSANGDATEEALEAIGKKYVRLDVPELIWPMKPTRFYGGPDVVIETDGEMWIWLSARSEGVFKEATEMISVCGVEWEGGYA